VLEALYLRANSPGFLGKTDDPQETEMFPARCECSLFVCTCLFLFDNSIVTRFNTNMARLLVINQSVQGLTHELGESWVTIGRSSDNNFQISEESISSHHCEVKVRGNELLVRDLCSTNGTFVDGSKVSTGTVKFGKTFHLGNVEVRVEASAASIPKVSVLSPNVSSAAAPRAVMPLPPKPVLEAGDRSQKFYQVLFVDDSMAFLDSFATLCGELSGGRWQIHTCATADLALSILKERHFDLAVLDIGMPMLDGIQLLGIVSRRYPNLKIAIMTAMASEANRATCLANGALLFLEKPTSPDGVKLAFNMLDDILVWTQKKGFSGALHHVELPDVIQMECLNGKSVILEVRNADNYGQVYIEEGKIIHAVIRSAEEKKTGEKAFQELLSLNGGQFQLHPFVKPSEYTICGPWEFLLLEASRLRDEKAPLQAPALPPAPAFPPSPVMPQAPVLPPAPVMPPAPAPVAEPEKTEEMDTRLSELRENIVIMDGDEDKWLSLGGSQTEIKPSE
jgi:pSer/pThr/pTyr-binding forkhead associated (FHA) protein